MSVHFSLQRAGKSHQTPDLDSGIFLQGSLPKAILLIHGLTGSPSEMGFVARRLHRKGYTVLVPRIAGHGDSIFVLKKYRWETFYASMQKAFAELHEKCAKGTNFYVGGLSMGALLALLLARDSSAQISGVICFSPTLFFDGWNVPWTQRLLPLAFHTPLKHFYYFREEAPYGLKNKAVRRHVDASYSGAKLNEFADAAKNGYAFFPVALFCELQRLIGHLTALLSEITVPLLLLQAEEDDMTSVRNSEFIFAKVASRSKELFLLKDSYHVITADQERQTVADKTIEFCDMHSANNENTAVLSAS